MNIIGTCSKTHITPINFKRLKLTTDYRYSGPFSAIASYLSEFHSTANRSRVQLVRGTATGIASIILPVIAWIVLPHIYEISVTQNISE